MWSYRLFNLCSKIELIKLNKNDPYLKIIPFYKTNNKLRDRILLTNSINNVIVFLKINENDNSKINCKFSLYKAHDKICHLILISIRFIKKGEILCINKEKLKIRLN